MKKPLLLFSLCLFIACSSENPHGINMDNASGKNKDMFSEISQITAAGDGSNLIQISPAEATRNSILNLTIKDIKPHEAKIEWLVNGSPAAPQGMPHQFKAMETSRGDTVQARWIVDGEEILSNIVVIKNTPPELIRVKITPEVFKPGDRMYIDAAASDIDGDDVTISYAWSVNGEPAGDSREVGAQVKRGDRLSVKITPYDGITYGNSITLNREIKNMPPLIVADKNFAFDGKTYTYQIKASDADGDDLTYSLKTAPDGMTIDASGLIIWQVPDGFNGKAPAAVSVLDGKGGEASMSFNVEIKNSDK